MPRNSNCHNVPISRFWQPCERAIRTISRIWGKTLRFHCRQSFRRHPASLATVQVLECRQLLAADLTSPLAAGVTRWSAVGGDHSTVSGESVVVGLAAAGTTAQTPDTFDVVIPDNVRVGQLAVPISLNVSQASLNGTLDAWIDWNGDGNWGGAAEHVAVRIVIATDKTTLIVDVPGWARPGATVARFQLTNADGGSAEVQDDRFALLPPVYPSGQFGSAIPIDTTAAVQFTSTADLDRDGDMDILSATFDGEGTIAWYENNGSQNFTRNVITTDALDATSVLVEDMNGDGYLDVVAGSLSSNMVAWYENDGRQHFTGHIITTSAMKVSSLHVADLDGDGDPDIVCASKGDNVIAWYENSSDQGFTRHVITTSVDVPCAVFAADVDGDGDVDVISASFFDDTVAWFENDGHQDFTRRIIDERSDGVRGMYVADLDSDGDQDVVSSCLYGNTMLWYENTGRGQFTVHVISSTAINAAAVFVADMDGDGDLDVLGSSRGNRTIAWFENTGGLRFPQHTITTTNTEARAVIAADVDGDGDLDVISASKDGERLAWFENLINPTPITAELDSISPLVTTQPTIPVTVTFNTAITGFTAESLVVQNGTVTNFTGTGSTYRFDLIADREGTVTTTLPEGAVTDAWGFNNTATDFAREFTLVPPVLALGGGVATFVRNGVPIKVVPELTVSGSRIGGGTLKVVINSAKTRHPAPDALDETALIGLGAVARTSIAGKQITTVSLDSTTTAEDIQAALRSMTFSTSKFGLNVKTREVRIQLTDNSGQSRASLIQTIHVRRKQLTR